MYFYSFDDFIFENNTFNNIVYVRDVVTPFMDIRPQMLCDLLFRTQKVYSHYCNNFLNLSGSNLILNIDFSTPY